MSRKKRGVCNRSAYSRHVDRKKMRRAVAGQPHRSRRISRTVPQRKQARVVQRTKPRPMESGTPRARFFGHDLRSLFPVRRRDPTPGHRYRREEFVPLASKQRKGWVFDEPICPQSKLGPNTTVAYSAMGPGIQKGPPLASSDFH